MVKAASDFLPAAFRMAPGAVAPSERDPRLILAVVIGCAAFWALRVHYWSITGEQPFSDMVDYIGVGKQIRENLFFGASQTLYAYFTPVTPSLLAISMLLGGDNFLWVFRILVQTIAFVGMLLLAREIAIQTGRRWLGVLLIFVVAFCRPSIFWSYKPSTETPSEALLLLSLGLVLLASRTRSYFWAGASGLSCMLLALNRPQFMLAVAAVGVIFLLSGVKKRRGSDAQATVRRDGAIRLGPINLGMRRFVQVACFGLGLAIVWGPWIARNYLHHRGLILTATSGMDSIIFDYAGAPIRSGRYDELPLNSEATLRDFDFNRIKTSIYSVMNDYEAFRTERVIAVAWFRANWMDYPRLVSWRLKHLAAERGANGLSSVSREELFPPDMSGWNYPYTRKSWLDLLLIDKTPWVVFLALGGVAMLIWRLGWAGMLFGSIVVVPWFNVALVFGYERTVDPMVSITCWTAFYFIVELLRPSPQRSDVNTGRGA